MMTPSSSRAPRRFRLPLLACLAASLLGALPAALSGQAFQRAPALREAGCKPAAPIRVVLEEEGVSSGSRVDLRFRIEPLRAMQALDWELELPADTFVAAGEARGRARLERGSATEGRVRLSMPTDERPRTARLVVRGVFEGSDELGNRFPEPVVSTSALVWGEPEPLGPLVLGPDEDGALVPHVALPTRHHPGRRPGWRPAAAPGAPGSTAATGAPESREPAASALLGGFSVTGVFEYEDKEWGYGGWTGVDPILPVRRADVTVLDDVTSTVLGTGTTGPDGSFSIVCTPAGVTDVVVRLDADTNLSGGQRIRVTDSANIEYTAFSPVFAGHDTTQDLDVGSTTATKLFSGSAEGNPFNMLDMAVSAWEYITGPLIGAAPGSTVRVWWPEAGGSFASGRNAHISGDDGYDDAVILHELGHVVHNLYSDSDNPGGSHFFGDSDQDPRLSFGEGYATFFGATVMIEELAGQGLYFDGNGAGQNGGIQLRLRLEGVAPYANDSYGAADEVAVAAALFDILDDEDSDDNQPGADDDQFGVSTLVNGASVHAAWWAVFTGPVATAANVTLNDAWNGWFGVHGVGGLHPELEDLYALRRVHFFNDVDEPNDSAQSATPFVVDGQWSGDRTLYSGSGNPPSPGLGDQDWYRIDLVAGSILEIETRYPGGASDADTQADTRLQMLSPSAVATTVDSGGTGRNAKLALFQVTETGPWTFRVDSSHVFRRYGRYNVRATYLFENLQPTVVAGPSATPALLGPLREHCQLGVTLDDDQPTFTLTYTWTPLDGGVISGSGESVTFTPPGVTRESDFRVQVVAQDVYGAESEPAVVTVTVRPHPRAIGPGEPVGP